MVQVLRSGVLVLVLVLRRGVLVLKVDVLLTSLPITPAMHAGTQFTYPRGMES